ncbi:YeeE/YedE thiosulfate transporter family protein [Desulfosediminicola flagellatus]|uniref:YeeE/YedE thiosulfate transporter family protein n=1 Tax=Desulfosediminicola flagellatus TaxID=2569541 RepID=UPI0010AC20E4|nr:rhodanese-like domain-containing protein [Desulfosediminicola flagellatus]
MINTLFLQDTLNSPLGFVLSLVLGLCFGGILERAGFSSSRKLAGVFYFRDMTVIKVMLTAVVTCMLGLAFLAKAGVVSQQNIYHLPTIYGAQIIGGLLFGAGFVIGGWCPGTAAAGMACGKADAALFLVGGILGSVFYNELYFLIKPLSNAGNQGVLYIYDTLGISASAFTTILIIIGVSCFALCEYLENQFGKPSGITNTFILGFSSTLVALAIILIALPEDIEQQRTASGLPDSEKQLLAMIAEAKDHIEPEELADRIMAEDTSLILVDLRPPAEFNTFHIRKARNIELQNLAEELDPYKSDHVIVLYSNGMTHAAQARDSLARSGYSSVYILTDGLEGFRERCLKPISLRPYYCTPEERESINTWRAYYASDI